MSNAAVESVSPFGPITLLKVSDVVAATANAHYQLEVADSSDLKLLRKQADLVIEEDGEQIAVVEDFYSMDGEGGFITPDGELIPFAAIELPSDQLDSDSVLVWEAHESAAYSWLTMISSGIGSAAGVALMASGSSESSASSSESEDASGTSSDSGTTHTITVTPTAGPFISDVDVAVYDADGNLLGTGSVNSETGNVELSLTTDYTGPILIVVTDTNGDDADYVSEATGDATSLGGSLSAMAVLDDSGELTVSVTPLTELAVQLAGITDVSDLTTTSLTSDQVDYNAIVAALFGLDDLLGDAVTVVESDYDESDGISAAELYGQLLAILSGSEENLGSIAELVEALASTITVTDGVATLSAEGASLLLDGLATFESGDNADLADTSTLASSLPYLLEDGSVQSGLNATEMSDGTTLVVPEVSEGDELVITLGSLTLSLAVTADMLDSSGSALIELTAEQLQQVGEGTWNLQVSVNGEDLQEIAITLDSTAPEVSIELSSSSVNAGETVTVTFTFSEAVSDFSNADVVLESGSLSELSSDDGGITWTATYIPASNTDDASALISVTGDFTDKLGNSAVTTEINGEALAAQTSLTVDTTRPTATLTVSEDTLQVGETATLTIVFSEAVTGFSVEDISAANATVTNLTSSDGGITWTATITAMEGFEDASNQVRIGTDYTDLSGNKPATSYGSNSYLVDTAGPVISSGNQVSLVENSGAGQLVYSAEASDMSTISYALSGTDADYFSIDETTGEITLLADPDYETRSTYNISLIATDAYGNQTTQAIVVQVTNVDEVAPLITSSATATELENTEAGAVVYTVTSTDSSDTSGGVTYSLSGTDASSFEIDSSTGEISLLSALDTETQASYSITVVATDAAGNSSSKTVTLTVTDLDESAPVITSVETVSIDENSGSDQLVYTLTATDAADLDDDTDTSDALTYSLSGDDAELFSLDAETGELTLLEDPDYETQSSYSVVVTATDAAGNSTSQTLTVEVNNLDESAPVITSAETVSIDENSGSDQLVVTVTATDTADVDDDTDTSDALTYSLSGDDAELFSLDAETGELTLLEDPDYETQSSYSVVLTVTDEAGNSTSQTLTVNVGDLDETGTDDTVVDDDETDESDDTVVDDDESGESDDTVVDDSETDESTDGCGEEDGGEEVGGEEDGKEGSGHHHHHHPLDALSEESGHHESHPEESDSEETQTHDSDRHLRDHQESDHADTVAGEDCLLTVEDESIDWLAWYDHEHPIAVDETDNEYSGDCSGESSYEFIVEYTGHPHSDAHVRPEYAYEDSFASAEEQESGNGCDADYSDHAANEPLFDDSAAGHVAESKESWEEYSDASSQCWG